MDGETFSLRWEEEERTEEAIKEESAQMAAENLMYLSQEACGGWGSGGGVGGGGGGYPELDAGLECVTEEVITDDWVVPAGQERVEVPLDHFTQPMLDVKEENDIDVPLPTDQDEYTAARPWPCDFCSRRFRKKAALVNHMVAHQSDRPHACNLCGVRYRRKPDLIHHLKGHAFVPETPCDPPPPSSHHWPRSRSRSPSSPASPRSPHSPHSAPSPPLFHATRHTVDYDDVLENHRLSKPKKKRGRRKKVPEPDVEEKQEDMWEHMTSARTQQWQRKRAPAARAALSPSPSPPPSPPSPSPPPSPPSPPPPPSRPADPSRPFVCRHCGVGFAREKALQSHARVHGGESPLECGACGELCWSLEALRAHCQRRHPHTSPPLPSLLSERHRTRDGTPESPLEDSDDAEYRLSESEGSPPPHPHPAAHLTRALAPAGDVRPPELFCQHCGVAFQRADLLRRHVAAAHSYRRRSSSNGGEWDTAGGGGGEHACDVCGEACSDALSLLAHAERHTAHRLKRNKRNISSFNRQFPCRECGKVFGSRSSQQIHVRIHTGERPYACRFCWKAFADGGTLRKHERIHTGEKPYACAVCPRAFNQRVVLREHVRSHHAAPARRAASGTTAPAPGTAPFLCAVCARGLPSSAELVAHLIQHCDDNTAARRHPQSGPRKYKRRKKLREVVKRSRSPSPAPSPLPPPPAPPEPPPPPPPRRTRRAPPAPAPRPQRPRMIHTAEEKRPRTKQVRGKGRGARAVPAAPVYPALRPPPRRPADDLRAIRPHLASPSPSPSPPPPPSPPAPDTDTAPPHVVSKHEPDEEMYLSPAEVAAEEILGDCGGGGGGTGAFRCEMCDARFERRDALLLHVPAHI